MPGPLYRYDEDNPSTTKFPEFWDMKWFFDDNNRAATARAVGLDADTVDNHKPPKTAVDITGLIGKTAAQAMGMDFGADGNLYVLDYGGGFFTTTCRQSLWKISYTGGPSTPSAAPRAIPIGDFKVNFVKGGSGGVSYMWEFGDGQTSTEANPHAHLRRGQALHGEADGDLRRRLDGRRHGRRRRARPGRRGRADHDAHDHPGRARGDGTYKKPVTSRSAADRHGRLGRGADRVPHQRRRVAGLHGAGRRVSSRAPTSSTTARATARATSRDDQDASPSRSTVIQNCPTNLNDEFNARRARSEVDDHALDDRRRFVQDGFLRLKVEAGDMIGDSGQRAERAPAGRAPAGSWVISTRINTSSSPTKASRRVRPLAERRDQHQQLRQDRLHQQGHHAALRVRLDAQQRRRTSRPVAGVHGEPVRGLPARELQRLEPIIAEGSIDGETWTRSPRRSRRRPARRRCASA